MGLSIKSVVARYSSLKEDEAEEFFNARTNMHIDLVKKYLDKIIEEFPKLDKDLLLREKDEHDQSKFKSPEHDSYVNITWNYKLKDNGKVVQLTDEEKRSQALATNHHVRNNKHHPEHWDKEFESVNLNDRDSNAVEIVDATKMPLEYIACMVADWLAMSEEKNTDPYDWADKNINVRWSFSTEQTDLIHEILDMVWSSLA